MKIGLFFGSFNPVHMGHLIIANIAYQETNLDEVWFVVSPQNPFKKNKNLLHEFDRMDLVQEAIAEDYHFRATNVEFDMPKPSYTIDTLAVLTDSYPQHEFSLILGEDNLGFFTKWKNYKIILEDFGLIVYPRPNSTKNELINHPNVRMIEAPEMDISATLIRRMVREGKSVKYLVPDSVEALIASRKLFI